MPVLQSCKGCLIDGVHTTCVFSIKQPGQPSTPYQNKECLFCSELGLQKAVKSAGGKSVVTRILRALFRQRGDHETGEQVFQAAKQRLKWVPDHAKDFVCKVEGARADTVAPEPADPSEPSEPEIDDPIVDHYQTKLQAARVSFGLAGAVLSSEWMSPAAVGLDLWCREGSWTQCPSCHRREPRILTEGDFRACRSGSFKAKAQPCKYCAKGLGYFTPREDDIPKYLRDLPPVVQEVLRPLHLNYEFKKRWNGYRHHVGGTKLCWKDESFAVRVSQLEDKCDRKLARHVHKKLCKSKSSSFKDFVQQHNHFLSTATETSSKWLQQKRILDLGIECALWPWLFVKTSWCPSAVRALNTKKRRRSAYEDPGSESSEEDGETKQNRSAKDAFTALAMSEVAGFSTDYSLLHFVYDQWLFATLNGATGVMHSNLRNILAGKDFSPGYWAWQHLFLLDMQKQLGNPSLFITIAPYEASFPMASWIKKLYKKLRKQVTQLSAQESWHIAHVLSQAVLGLLAGQTSGHSWTEHLFADRSGEMKNVRGIFLRLEFQDGNRLATTLPYHGRGSVHVHFLVWLASMSAAELQHLISAALPADRPELAALVKVHQLSHKEHTLPLCKESIATSDSLMVERNAAAKKLNVRAYIGDILSALRAHMDVLWGLGHGLLLRYVAGYVPKFSDSFQKDWLEGCPTGWNLASRVLHGYRPLEPQMWLALSRQKLVRHSGMAKKANIPDPDSDDTSVLWQAYMDCTTRCEDMSFWKWLHCFRLVAGAPQIYQWAAKRYEALVEPKPSLEDWLQDLELQGEVLVGCSMYKHGNPKWFGQWLLLNVPHRTRKHLVNSLCRRAPSSVKWFAAALAARPDFWRNQKTVKAMMELEGHKENYVDSFWAEVCAYTELLDNGCVEGVDAVMTAKLQTFFALNSSQRRHLQDFCQALKKTTAFRAEAQDDVRRVQPHAFAELGAPGTGKSQVVKALIAHAVKQGATVLVTCPTGKQVASWRSLFPDLNIDTVHGATQYNCTNLSGPPPPSILAGYDVWIVEEVGQLSLQLFEYIMELYFAGGAIPLLIFAGDFLQLPALEQGEDGFLQSSEPCCRSELWKHHVRERVLHQPQRSCDPELLKPLALLRTHKPTKQVVQSLRSGRQYHRAGEVTAEVVMQVRKLFPHTTFVTWSLKAAEQINQWISEEKFKNSEALGVIAWQGMGSDCTPIQGPVYAGQRITLTFNKIKKMGFVNGMGGMVQRMSGLGVEVRTDVHTTVWVHPMKDEYGTWSFPMRLGYAVNLSKIQGETIEHMSLWLDTPNVEAAGYVAMSRVRRLEDVVFLGRITPYHFRPSERLGH
jgi:hypothetical protein